MKYTYILIYCSISIYSGGGGTVKEHPCNGHKNTKIHSMCKCLKSADFSISLLSLSILKLWHQIFPSLPSFFVLFCLSALISPTYCHLWAWKETLSKCLLYTWTKCPSWPLLTYYTWLMLISLIHNTCKSLHFSHSLENMRILAPLTCKEARYIMSLEHFLCKFCKHVSSISLI